MSNAPKPRLDPPPPAELSLAEIRRYSRHLTLPQVGMEGQRKLKNAKILLVGTGGLGSPLALYLAAAGIGTLGMVEFDVVDESNLQRQVLYGTADVGRLKIDAARGRISDLNPHVRVVQHHARLTRGNALDIIGDYDIVADGTDNFATRYLVNDACVLLGKPNVYGSIFRFEGQLSVFHAEEGPCYRCLFPEPPPPGLVPSCAEGGVLGVLPGIIGSLQALEVIKLVLGTGQPMIGRLLLFDALDLRSREMKLAKDPACAVCGATPSITELIDYDHFCDTATPQTQGEVPSITPVELKTRLIAGEPLTLVDVRETHEWEITNLAEYDARLIPLSQLVGRLGELDPHSDVVVHCKSGARSARAVRQLLDAGFARPMSLEGGILAWADSVDPQKRKY